MFQRHRWETAQTNEFMPYLFLLVNTVSLNQSKRPNSTHNTNRHYRVPFNTFVGQPLSKQQYLVSVEAVVVRGPDFSIMLKNGLD